MVEHGVHTPHALLAEVERLDASASGAFVVELDHEPVGSVFVERGRVCWSAAVGLGRRLRELLREHLAGPRREDAMWTALRQHTIESLLAMPEHQGEVISWWPHRRQGYRPRFTFSPLELLLAVNARLYPSLAAGHERARSFLAEPALAASYVLGDDDEPLAIGAGSNAASITEVVELGEWVAAAFSATPGFRAAVLARAIREGGGAMAVGWRTSRRQLHAAVFTSARELLRATAVLGERSYPVVFCRRAQSSPTEAARDDLGTVATTHDRGENI